MFWKIFLLVMAGLILLLGVIKTWREVRQKKRGRKPTRDLIIAVVLAFLVGTYSIIQLLQPNEIKKVLKPIPEIIEKQERIEQKIDLLRSEIGEPVRYKNGIPQSQNLNLRELFKVGEKHLSDYEYEEAIKAFRAALALQNLSSSEAAALLIHIGIAPRTSRKIGPLGWFLSLKTLRSSLKDSNPNRQGSIATPLHLPKNGKELWETETAPLQLSWHASWECHVHV